MHTGEAERTDRLGSSGLSRRSLNGGGRSRWERDAQLFFTARNILPEYAQLSERSCRSLIFRAKALLFRRRAAEQALSSGVRAPCLAHFGNAGLGGNDHRILSGPVLSTQGAQTTPALPPSCFAQETAKVNLKKLQLPEQEPAEPMFFKIHPDRTGMDPSGVGDGPAWPKPR